MEQVQISSGGAINYSPLFHEFSENSKVSKRENIFWWTILAYYDHGSKDAKGP